MRLAGVALLLGVLAAGTPVFAQSGTTGTDVPPSSSGVSPVGDTPPAPHARRELSATIASALNPAGLLARVEVKWVRPLSRSASPLLSDAHLALGVSPEVTPSYARLGAWAEIAPVSFLGVRAGIEPAGYFGTFSSLVSFANLDDPFDSGTMRARRGEARPGGALRMYVRPWARMKVGRLGGQVDALAERWESTAGGPFYYEPSRNTLIPAHGGRVTLVSAAGVYQASPLIGLGALYEVTRVRGAAANRIQRLASLITYVPPFAVPALGRPTMTVVSGTYLRDPHRHGQVFAALVLDFRLGKR